MVLIFLLAFVFSSCSCLMPFGSSEAPSEESPNVNIRRIDTEKFSQIVIPFALELRKTHRLRFEDCVVYYDNTVERVRVIFSSQDILELCSQRDLMVTVVEGLLERFNSDPEIAMSFDHSPISASDLELYFSYESLYIELDDPSYIAWMSLTDGIVRFVDGNIKNPRIDFWDSRTEPYFKTLEFVQITRAYNEAVAKEEAPKKDKEGKIRTIE